MTAIGEELKPSETALIASLRRTLAYKDSPLSVGAVQKVGQDSILPYIRRYHS